MRLAPPFLQRPCPWCGERTVVPPATPITEWSHRLEERCRHCRGGVRCRTSWASFGVFVGGFATAAICAVASTRDQLATLRHGPLPQHDWLLLAAWALAVLTVASACSWFLVSNSAIERGAAPRR